jgi:hypothetical protein
VTLPPAISVDIAQELAQIRAALNLYHSAAAPVLFPASRRARRGRLFGAGGKTGVRVTW